MGKNWKIADPGIFLLNIAPRTIPTKAAILATIIHKHPNTSPYLLSYSSFKKYLKKNKLLININTIPMMKNIATRSETCIILYVSLIKFRVSNKAITPSIVIPHLNGNTKQHFGEFGSLSTNKDLILPERKDILVN